MGARCCRWSSVCFRTGFSDLILSLLLFVGNGESGRSADGSAARGPWLTMRKDVQSFINVTAKTGAINALANLMFLLALRVHFPVL